MEATINKWAIAETYLDVQLLIKKQCNKYHSRYGGDFYDWLSEANYIFMEAYYSFDESAGACFSTYLYWLLDKRLIELIRRPARKSRVRKIKVHYVENVGERGCPPMKLIDRLKIELSEDANEIVDLIMDVPMDIKLAMLEPRKQQTKASKFKECLVEFLQDVGWSVSEISKSFEEIKECL